MDVRNWAMDQIMQLPDNCFGQRWVIGLTSNVPNANAIFDICEAGLPEVCVIWEVCYTCFGSIGMTLDIGLALGDQPPATEAAYALLPSLMPEVVSRTSGRGHQEILTNVEISIRRPRLVVASGGRRIVGRFIRVLGNAVGGQVALVVSSIPTEVPDCLLSV